MVTIWVPEALQVAEILCLHGMRGKCWARAQAWPGTQLCSHVPPCLPMQVGRRSIINKLFFDLAQEEEGALDAEFLKVPGISLILLSPMFSARSFCSPPLRASAWGS